MKISRKLGLFFTVSFFLSSCFKEDTTPPTLHLKGEYVLYIPLKFTYKDPGIIAEDNKDGDISQLVEVSGWPNTQQAGQYFVKYNVTDASGNPAKEIQRIVFVAHQNTTLSGIYRKLDSCNTSFSEGLMSVSVDNANAQSLFLSKFGTLNENYSLSAYIQGHTGQNIVIPEQILEDTLYSGSGTINGSGTQIDINYTKTHNFNTTSCTTTLIKESN